MSPSVAKCQSGLLKCGEAVKKAEASFLTANSCRLQRVDSVVLGIAFLAIALFVVVPLDPVDLLLLLVGGIAFFFTRPTTITKHSAKNRCVVPKPSKEVKASIVVSPTQHAPEHEMAAGHLVTTRPTVVPFGSLGFVGSSFESDVAELLPRLEIGPSVLEKLHCLERTINDLISTRLPDVKVQVFANLNPDAVQAFASAIPEVSVVVNTSLERLARDCNAKADPNAPSKERNAKDWVKRCLRICMDCLINNGFKFRRSGFRDDEPKSTFTWISHGLSIEMSVNNSVPSKFQALLDHCAAHDPVAKNLVLLVRFWARQRGVAHTVSGALSPFAWVVLALFYLQVAPEVNQQGRRLATLRMYLHSLATAPPDAQVESATNSGRSDMCETSLSKLLRGFIRFYTTDFDWNHEIISLRAGIRQNREGLAGELARIENPFQATNDLAACVTREAFALLRGELERTYRLLDENASLGQILEPWMPPPQQ